MSEISPITELYQLRCKEEAALPPNRRIALRRCLGCERNFPSLWIGNRLCDSCKGASSERVPAQPRSIQRAATAGILYEWLATQDEVIPSLGGIAQAMGGADAYRIHGLLTQLRGQARISWRSGTRSERRGHQAIRLASGKVLKTVGCPFEPPP